jgi:glycosyltransferase involved in cell wall biosynthesis
MPLKIAAKVDRVDQGYWEEKIRPMVQSHSNVEFIGEIGESDKVDFLSEAAALLFPGDWPEPFGLVMIEAMACGTPVIAFRHGSVPEVVQDGVSGFIVDRVEEAERAVQQLANLDRAKVRADFERRFTVERMAGDYLEIYRELAAVRATSTQVHRLNGKEVPLPTAADLAVATKASKPGLAHPSKSDPRMARGNSQLGR